MNKTFHASDRKPLFWTSLLVLLSLVLAACSPAAAPTQAAPTVAPTVAMPEPTATVAATMAPTTAAMPEAEAEVAVVDNPDFGPILVDGKGMTLYGFTKDTPDTVNCAGGCLEAWPPLISQGSPVAGEGVDAAMLGTTDLADGRKIVTYNHMPLYYWAKDTQPGDTTGQDVNDVWYVVSPEGQMVKTEGQVPATGSTPAPTTEATSGAAMSGVTINVATNPTLGEFLVDGEGMALYMFKKDTPDTVNCSGGCLEAWPPLVADDAASVTAGDGVDETLIGVADLADGRKIVTYNHMPLYYWAKDTKPGDVTGQDVNDVWYVVAPDGTVIEGEAPASSAPAALAAGDVLVNVAEDAKLGNILVDEKGMTLYMFTKDEPDKVNCAGKCLEAWPPFLVEGAPKAGDGVDQAMLGTATMADGKKIVTYNHMPLYYWAGDVKAGDTTGQDVNKVWYVVAPDGKPVGMDGAN